MSHGHSLEINLKGSAGQSFCAFLAKGVTVKLVGFHYYTIYSDDILNFLQEGEANDYVGKVGNFRRAELCGFKFADRNVRNESCGPTHE